LERLTRELTPEEDAHIIDQISEEVVNRGLDAPAIMFLESIKPVAFIGSQLGLTFVAPFLMVFWDLGVDYIKFFEKRENVEKLLKTIEEKTHAREEEKKNIKRQQELLSEKFRFKLDLIPGCSVMEDNPPDGRTSKTIRIETRHGGLIVIDFTPIVSPPDYSTEISAHINSQRIGQTAMLSQLTLKKLESRQQIAKIRGHTVAMESYEWQDQAGQRGIVEGYGFWCNKSERTYLLCLKSAPLSGQKKEKDQTRDLRRVVASLRCH
jgi:hypothetical protein